MIMSFMRQNLFYLRRQADTGRAREGLSAMDSPDLSVPFGAQV